MNKRETEKHDAAEAIRRSDRERLLEILKCCRHDLAIAMARMRLNGPLYNSTAELLASIEAVALVLTNRPDYLHDRPHSTP